MIDAPIIVDGGATAGEISEVLDRLGIAAIDEIIKDLFTFETEDEDGETLTYEVGEDLHQIAEVVTTPRPFLETPLDEFTVSEGLLLCILVVMIINALVRMVRGAFFWL